MTRVVDPICLKVWTIEAMTRLAGCSRIVSAYCIQRPGSKCTRSSAGRTNEGEPIIAQDQMRKQTVEIWRRVAILVPYG